MATKSTIEIRFTGIREEQPLNPGNVDVDYLIEALTHARDLLNETRTENEPLTITLHEGSLALRHETQLDLAEKFDATLARFGENLLLNPLDKIFRRGLEGLKKMTTRYGDTIVVNDASQQLLRITPDTEFREDKNIWVEAEIYLRGKINNAGGVSNPNIHVDTDDDRFGKLLVRATKEQLANDEKNRLYKPQTMRVRIMQDMRTGAFDLGSATLLEFVETTSATHDVKDYIDDLIGRSSGFFSTVKDPERWLAQIRGYED